MKKLLIIALTVFMALSLIGCSKQSEETVFPQMGTFFDQSKQTMLTIEESDDINKPFWKIRILGSTSYEGYVNLQENSLLGEVNNESDETEKTTVTISQEDKNVYVAKLGNGEEYHFISTDDLKVIGTVSVNTQGNGQVACAISGEEVVFSDETPIQSFQVNVFEAQHYTFAAKPDEGWKFQHWKVNGDLFSQEEQIELYVDHNIELEAVFTMK